MQQALFDTGHEVGRMATERYTGGILIEEDYMNHEAAVRSTLDAMKDPGAGAIFEAAYADDRPKNTGIGKGRDPQKPAGLLRPGHVSDG